MRRRFLLVLLAMGPLLASAGEPVPSTPAMKEKFHAVIRQQLEAFRRGDYASAYGFAAPGIKAQFPLAAFTEMVRRGYPIIAKSNDVSFGLALDDGERAVVTVYVAAPDDTATFQYLLERHEEEWRIAGVQELKGPDKPI